MNMPPVSSSTWRGITSLSISHPPPSPLRSSLSVERGPAAGDVMRTGTLIGPSLNVGNDLAMPTEDPRPLTVFLDRVMSAFHDFVAHLPQRLHHLSVLSASATTAADNASKPGSMDDPSSLNTTKQPLISNTTSPADAVAPKPGGPRVLRARMTVPPSVTETTPLQLPPSTIPFNRISTPSRAEPATLLVSETPLSKTTRRVFSPASAVNMLMINDFHYEVLQPPNPESGFVVVAPRVREQGEVEGSVDGGTAAEPEGRAPFAALTSPVSLSTFPTDPLSRSVTAAIAYTDPSDSVVSSHPCDVFLATSPTRVARCSLRTSQKWIG